jgi:DNA repair exonuclease SbcCD nuclease subunit
MKPPYLLVSDIHLHKWSPFSTVNADGINSRLAIQHAELERAGDELLKRGGDTIYIAGDFFHQRGSIDPEVMNPSHSVIRRMIEKGIKFIAIPGNHDLVGRHTTELGNAFQTFGAMNGFSVVLYPDLVAPNVSMIPWCATKDELREAVKQFIEAVPGCTRGDLIIHVGIDGMLDGVPATGLSPAEVASWGFRRVFAGDYHNHRVAEGGKVVSIGATTHQTWSDLGSKAGFVFVYDDRIEFQASHAPSFVEITGEDEPDEIPLIVDGNYVRVRAMKLADAEIKKFRKELEGMGARGVHFQVARETVSARAGSTPVKASTLDESVDKFIDTMPEVVDVAAVKAQCTDVLNQVRSIAA